MNLSIKKRQKMFRQFLLIIIFNQITSKFCIAKKTLFLSMKIFFLKAQVNLGISKSKIITFSNKGLNSLMVILDAML